MKNFLFTAGLMCVLFITGCDKGEIITNLNFHLPYNVSDTTVFVSGMGCSDLNCTDTSHHHDCLPDCEDYDHHHNCSLDCTEASHHHSSTSRVNETGHHHSEKQHGGNHH